MKKVIFVLSSHVNKNWSNNDKPLILLDIDGVLNVLTHTTPSLENVPANRSRLESFIADGYYIEVDPTLRTKIVQLEEHFTIVWSTMWLDKATTHFAPHIGYGHDWEYINFQQHHDDEELSERIRQQTKHIPSTPTTLHSNNIDWRWSVGLFKHPGILATVGDLPAVVIDDDLEPWQHAWAEQRTLGGSPTLTIQPFCWEGLTDGHIDTITQFGSHLKHPNTGRL